MKNLDTLIKFVGANKLLKMVLIMSIYGLGVSACAKEKSSQTVHKSDITGLLTWTSIAEGISLELVQMLPDFVRARYGSQGFPSSEIEEIATYCVFGTIMKNTSQKILSYKVDDWYTVIRGESTKTPIKSKPFWLDQWRSADINFHWTLFPEEGEFSIGDWQQGFTTIKVPRNKHFDLIYRWSLDNKNYESQITDIICAPESRANE